jgi:hypothetical protein
VSIQVSFFSKDYIIFHPKILSWFRNYASFKIISLLFNYFRHSRGRVFRKKMFIIYDCHNCLTIRSYGQFILCCKMVFKINQLFCPTANSLLQNFTFITFAYLHNFHPSKFSSEIIYFISILNVLPEFTVFIFKADAQVSYYILYFGACKFLFGWNFHKASSAYFPVI